MQKKQKILVANWKMNPTSLKEGEKLFDSIAKTAKQAKNVLTIISPPSIFLPSLAKRTKSSKLRFGAQDAYFENEGAYTGLTSVKQVRSSGATYLIIGHSEVRARGEQEDFIQKKIRAALAEEITPILCIGEKERDDQGTFFEILANQLESALHGLPFYKITSVVLAYEPVWAIGKDAKRSATPQEAEETALVIRKYLFTQYGKDVASSVRILYGGSVDDMSVKDFLEIPSIQGLLIGRASLDKTIFSKIITLADSI